jgi:hypothetical protein
MKVNGNKILVECELPSDYGSYRLMGYEGLPSLNGDLFYVINKNNNLAVREYLEDGFTFEDKVIDSMNEFTIYGHVQGGMGIWVISYRVCVDSDGHVKNIYELNSDIKDTH